MGMYISVGSLVETHSKYRKLCGVLDRDDLLWSKRNRQEKDPRQVSNLVGSHFQRFCYVTEWRGDASLWHARYDVSVSSYLEEYRSLSVGNTR